MDQIAVCFPPETLAFLKRTAEREFRTVGAQIRFMIEDAAKRAGNAPPPAKPALEPWPPPLPTVTPENLPEIKSPLAEWTAERDRLARRETKVGPEGLMPHQHDRLGWLRTTIATLRVRVDQLEGRRPSEPRRPGPPDLR